MSTAYSPAESQENIHWAHPPRRRREVPFVILPASAVAGLPRDRSGRFDLRAPAHWKSPLFINPHALEAQRETLAWFASLGCTESEVKSAERFDIAGCVGIPFPTPACDKTVRMAKYLSMWLLWDDVHIETLENQWRIGAEHVLANRRPPGMTRFDEGWWQLLRELAAKRSPRWIGRLCRAMATWSTAAREEAHAKQHYRAHGTPPSFERHLELRTATIGLYGVICLLEDAYDRELPAGFLAHPATSRIQDLSNTIVGIGNELLAFCKDSSDGYLNLVSTLMIERAISCEDAFVELVHLHNELVQEFDRVAATVEAWPGEENPLIRRWLQDIRVASAGFSLWEARAPRYTADKLVLGGRVIEPGFCFSAISS